MEDNGEKKTPKTNYQSNSMKSKDAPAERREVKQITQGGVTQRKKTIGDKFRETFIGDDAQSVGSYILFDVVIPATKNLINDMVSQGIERLLFGTATPRRSSGSRTGYNTMYKSSGPSSSINRDNRTPERSISSRNRANFDFREIVLESRVEGLEVLNSLTELIEDYGTATVADLYGLVGITSEFTDQQWGWDNLADSQVRYVREGYLLDLPRPIVLN